MQILQISKKGIRSRRRKKRGASFARDVGQRHALAFGTALQRRVSELVIGIGAVGGLGMVLVDQLMRLFPGKLIVGDRDSVSISNLNRLPGATALDARLGTHKAELALRHVLTFNPNQQIEIVKGDFLERPVQEVYRECDIFFSPFDNVAARLSANQLCMVHGIILFDLGVGVIVKRRRMKAAGGQVIKVTPGSGFCLACKDFYDRREAAAEFMDAEEHKRQEAMGYIRGAHIEAPQVYSLNCSVASLAVWWLMRFVAGEDLEFDGIAYNALDFSVHTWKEERSNPNGCPVCGDEGLAMTGDSGNLLVRPSRTSSAGELPRRMSPACGS